MIKHSIKETKNIKSLVLSGGGLRGIAYIGLVKYLEENDLFKNIESFVGSSAGGIFCFLFNLGYSYAELLKVIKIIFPSFHQYQTISIDSIINLLNTYGLEEGKKINQLLKRLMIIRGFSPYITFKELYNKTKKKLTITVTNLNERIPIYVNYQTFPDLKVIDAIEMTYRIPVLFVPILYKNNYYADGGITNNFPINQVNDKNTMLGVYIRGNNRIVNFSSFVISVIDTFINLQPNNNRNNKNCLDIDLFDISIYSDKISDQSIDYMINEGYQQTKKFFLK